MTRSETVVSECMERLRGMISLPEANKLTILMVQNLFALAFAEGDANGFKSAIEVAKEESQPETWK